MQRQDERAAAFERRLGAADLSHAGEEGEDIARVRLQCVTDRCRNGAGQVARRGDVPLGVLDRNREHAAGALHHGGVHQRRQPCPIRRGRHGEEPQLGPQLALKVQAEGQCQVPRQSAFVDFVQDDQVHAI